MNRVRTPKVAGFAALVAAVVMAATALADLPRPTRVKIVPFQAFGAVELGVSKTKAFQKWGPGSCAVGTGGRDTCVWSSSTSTDFPEQAAVLEIANRKVCGMLIRAGTNRRSGELTITRLRKWQTEGGVGLGSSLRAAKKVLGGKLVAEKHKTTTAFFPGTTDQSRKQVEEIRIFKRGCEVT